MTGAPHQIATLSSCLIQPHGLPRAEHTTWQSLLAIPPKEGGTLNIAMMLNKCGRITCARSASLPQSVISGLTPLLVPHQSAPLFVEPCKRRINILQAPELSFFRHQFPPLARAQGFILSRMQTDVKEHLRCHSTDCRLVFWRGSCETIKKYRLEGSCVYPSISLT